MDIQKLVAQYAAWVNNPEAVGMDGSLTVVLYGFFKTHGIDPATVSQDDWNAMEQGICQHFQGE